MYEGKGEESISSLGELIPDKTTVYFCRNCDHIQTEEIQDIEDYYSSQYKILMESDEQDQIFAVKGKPDTFRFDFQSELLFKHCDITRNAKVLEYGSAKAATLKKVNERRPDTECYAFDVSEMYIPFWDKFLPKHHQATFVTPEAWYGQMDCVMSFYVLEHVSDLQSALHNINSLLKVGGTLYFVVPNVFGNVADMIVCDHCNHFSENSIEFLLQANSFDIDILESDRDSPALVVKATKLERPLNDRPVGGKISCFNEAQEIAGFWQEKNISLREGVKSRSQSVAIYGAGVYGRYIAASIRDLTQVHCFIDQNPYLQGKFAFDVPIVAPDNIPSGIDTIYIGLNPSQAKSIIANSPYIGSEKYQLIFL